MRRVKVICSLFWFVFSLVVVLEASRIRMGEMNQPGPGFFPLSIGLLMGVLSLVALFQSFKNAKPERAPTKHGPLRWWNVVLIPLLMAACALSLEKIGFLVNTFILVVLLLKVVEPQPWKTAILGGLITALAANLVFNVLLGAQIPSGILGF